MTAVDHSLVERIAQHLHRPIEKIVRTKSRLHLLDWLACVAGARQSQVARLQAGGRGAAAAEKAAWLGNVLEMDDVHRTAILHPGPAVWPTVLGMGGDALDDALDAGVRGYEAMIGIGAMLDGRHYAYWHNTATAGSFGAAAAAVFRLDASEAQLVSALGLAGSVTGGLWQMRHEPVMAKQWHLAHAMMTGTAAARHAVMGITGPRFILEGPQGLFAATCDAPKPLVLGEGWRIDQVSFKPWGACRHAHPAIDAALELKAMGALEGAVTVVTYRDALIFCDRPDPKSVIDAKFSLQHAVAIVMERGVPQLADFEPDAIAALADARRQVTVVESEALTRAYPAHFGATLSSGKGRITLADARGDPERPLSEAGVVEKARALMAWGGVDIDEASEMIVATLEGDRVSDIMRILEGWL
ncbi:MmgE/PrpD family protein [Sphingobium estronivorans]|uniref:MmgE/PrpD family protein n=1 Tax=Sphingobium estronivorans TaxID=1577690 RepID=UPI00123C016C|nr:MmgE/PrpD family protein [Sphingobium estronivorans]